MGTYAVTGSASGMGGAVVAKLRSAGHTVIGVDINDAEIVADLSTPGGRRGAAAGVLAGCSGVVGAAGLPARQPSQRTHAMHTCVAATRVTRSTSARREPRNRKIVNSIPTEFQMNY